MTSLTTTGTPAPQELDPIYLAIYAHLGGEIDPDDAPLEWEHLHAEGLDRDPALGFIERYQFEITDVSVNLPSSSDNGAGTTSLMVRSQDKVVFLDLSMPEYCDDECDAHLDWMSEVMTPEAAVAHLHKMTHGMIGELRDHVMQTLKRMDDTAGKLMQPQEQPDTAVEFAP